jgi:hypothetical protein
LLGGSKNVTAIANVAQDPVNIWDQMCGKSRNRKVAASDSGDELDDDEDSDDPQRRINRAALMSELPPSMKPIRVHTGPAKDDRGRPMVVQVVNGRLEVVIGVAEAKPVRLPKVAPMPRKRPDNS